MSGLDASGGGLIVNSDGLDTIGVMGACISSAGQGASPGEEMVVSGVRCPSRGTSLDKDLGSMIGSSPIGMDLGGLKVQTSNRMAAFSLGMELFMSSLVNVPIADLISKIVFAVATPIPWMDVKSRKVASLIFMIVVQSVEFQEFFLKRIIGPL